MWSKITYSKIHCFKEGIQVDGFGSKTVSLVTKNSVCGTTLSRMKQKYFQITTKWVRRSQHTTSTFDLCCDRRTRFIVIWKHFCFILSAGSRIRIDSVMCPQSSNTSASVLVSVTASKFTVAKRILSWWYTGCCGTMISWLSRCCICSWYDNTICASLTRMQKLVEICNVYVEKR